MANSQGQLSHVVGGYTAGPRFIIPALALMGPLVALGVQRTPKVAAALLVVSVANYLAINTVNVW
jgi:hypothetical protein